MSTFTKYIRSENKRNIDREYETQLIASKYGFSPKIYNYTVTHDSEKKYYEGKLVMENLEEMCIADMYGDDAKNIPALIWTQMRNILNILYEEEGIEYIDITGYNFIEKKGKVYIIDFGDAIYTKKDREINWFLSYFLGGHNGWNPDFK